MCPNLGKNVEPCGKYSALVFSLNSFFTTKCTSIFTTAQNVFFQIQLNKPNGKGNTISFFMNCILPEQILFVTEKKSIWFMVHNVLTMLST